MSLKFFHELLRNDFLKLITQFLCSLSSRGMTSEEVFLFDQYFNINVRLDELTLSQGIFFTYTLLKSYMTFYYIMPIVRKLIHVGKQTKGYVNRIIVISY